MDRAAPTRCGRSRAARRTSARPRCALSSPLGLWQISRRAGRRRPGARLSELPRAGEVHAARHRQPPVADRRAAGAPARRGHGVPPAARVPPGRRAARHRLEGDRAHRAPDRARVRGREGPARAAGDRLRPAHGVQGRRALALRPRAERRAAARPRRAAPGRRGRHDDHGRHQPLQRAAQVGRPRCTPS